MCCVCVCEVRERVAEEVARFVCTSVRVVVCVCGLGDGFGLNSLVVCKVHSLSLSLSPTYTHCTSPYSLIDSRAPCSAARCQSPAGSRSPSSASPVHRLHLHLRRSGRRRHLTRARLLAALPLLLLLRSSPCCFLLHPARRTSHPSPLPCLAAALLHQLPLCSPCLPPCEDPFLMAGDGSPHRDASLSP